MRIEAYNQVQQLYQKTQTPSTEKGTSVKKRDQVQISSFGYDYQIAKQALAEVPDEREDLISSIKTRMEAGTYRVDGKSFADKLMEKYTDILSY